MRRVFGLACRDVSGDSVCLVIEFLDGDPKNEKPENTRFVASIMAKNDEDLLDAIEAIEAGGDKLRRKFAPQAPIGNA